MKIINLIKCEFKKNFSLIKFIIHFVILLISCLAINFITTDLMKNGIIYEVEEDYVYHKEAYDETKAKYDKNPNIANEYSYIMALERLEALNIIYDDKSNTKHYGEHAAFMVGWTKARIFLIDKVLEEADIPWDNEAISGLQDVYLSLTEEELIERKETMEKDLEIYEQIIPEKSYYKFLALTRETSIEKNRLLEDKKELEKDVHYRYTSFIIDNKIEDDRDIRAVQYSMATEIWSENSMYSYCVDSKYKSDNCPPSDYHDDEAGYKRFINNTNEKFQSKIEMAIYGAEHNIKSNVDYWGFNHDKDDYFTVRQYTKNIFFIIIVVFVLVLSSNSGIISKEINDGSARLLLSTPNKRWKIYLSKYIYIVLHFLILYLISYIILFILGGLRYGFDDLFIPQLIFDGSKVIEVNYVLWFIKTSFIAFIPYLAVLAIMQFLSSITKNSGITVTVLLIPTIVSYLIFFIIFTTKFSLFAYLPTTYLAISDIFFKTQYYLYATGVVNHLDKLYYVVPIIYLIVFYILGNLNYSRKDI